LADARRPRWLDGAHGAHVGDQLGVGGLPRGGLAATVGEISSWLCLVCGAKAWQDGSVTQEAVPKLD
jgi:hypothetical protein